MASRLPPTSRNLPDSLVMQRRSALGVLASTFLSCQYTSSPSGETPVGRALEGESRRPLTVLIAIDGVRWQDIYLGPSFDSGVVSQSRSELIPHLIEMEKNGISWGAPGEAHFYASGPNFVSLPGYMEMLSGTSATACTENDCQRMKKRTLLDDFGAETPNDPTRAGAFSSWPKIEVAASRKKHGVVSAGRNGGFHHEFLDTLPRCRQALAAGRAESGGHGDARSDARTAELARAFLHEADPDFLFVSLGESDEAAHRGSYEDYLKAVRFADTFIGEVRSDLRHREREGRETLLLVTTDHGRAHNFKDHGRKHPESSRAFLFAEGTGIRPLGRIRTGNAYLKDIAPTIRAVSGLPEQKDSGSGRVLREILS